MGITPMEVCRTFKAFGVKVKENQNRFNFLNITFSPTELAIFPLPSLHTII